MTMIIRIIIFLQNTVFLTIYIRIIFFQGCLLFLHDSDLRAVPAVLAEVCQPSGGSHGGSSTSGGRLYVYGEPESGVLMRWVSVGVHPIC